MDGHSLAAKETAQLMHTQRWVRAYGARSYLTDQCPNAGKLSDAGLKRAAAELLLRFKQRNTVRVVFSGQRRSCIFEDGQLRKVENAASLLKMAAECSFFRARQRDMDMGLSIRDNPAGIQNLEGPFHSLVFIHCLQRRRGHVVIGALLNGARRDQDLSIADILLLDDAVDRFKQKSIAIQQDSIYFLNMRASEDSWRRPIGARRLDGCRSWKNGYHRRYAELF